MSEPHKDLTLGIPRGLPRGERPLWSGGPAAGRLARSALHVRKLAVYFAALLVWRLVIVWRDGFTWPDATNAVLTTALLAAVVLGVARFYAWASARSTTYTITTQRVVIRTGIALPISINLPFSQIDSVDLRRDGEGGDIELTLSPGAKAGYLILWPSAKPLHFSPARPMLRALADLSLPASVLSEALAAQSVDNNAAHPAAPVSESMSAAARMQTAS